MRRRNFMAAAAIPAIYQFRDFTVAGGLLSYDPAIVDVHRQIGGYVGKILKGALPADSCQSNSRRNFSCSSI
jgi:putative ABC transport system substrate-binding protein